MNASIPRIRSSIPGRMALLKALHQAGAKIVAGTDTGMPLVPTGLGLHWELKHFVDAGFTPLEALQCATSRAAACLGTGEIGMIQVGKRADLVLLDANPLDDIRNVSKIAGVMARGRWLPREELESRLRADGG